MKGLLAQRLEQRTHNPLVAGSNPAGPTRLYFSYYKKVKNFALFLEILFFDHCTSSVLVLFI